MVTSMQFNLGCLVVLALLGAVPSAAQSTLVGVLDHGVDSSHPMLAGRVEYPYGYARALNARQGLGHGTAVASVILQHSRSARVGSVVWNYSDYLEWKQARDRCLLGDATGCSVARWHVGAHMRFHAQLWKTFPIVNSSHGLSLDSADTLSRLRTSVPVQLVREVRQYAPEIWALYAQHRHPPHLRSVHVRAIGNDRRRLGPEAMDLHAVLTYLFPELWGHTLFVTAIDPRTGLIADYANFCGTLPPGWDRRRHGRHFCVAAPGTHRVALPGGGAAVQTGTSYAAPYVVAVLAELYERCRVSGTALLRLLLDTADRAPPYHDEIRYGAGLIRLERSLRACG